MNHTCYDCGVNKTSHPWKLCPECYQKACEAGENYLKDKVLKAKSIIPNNPAVWSDPNPKFWLWDFRSRKVCNWSFMYGCLFAASASCAGLGLSKSGDAVVICFAFAWCLLVFSKRAHSKLLLAERMTNE